MVARGFQSASHPILAQIVPIRRCNLACTYCNEYDKHSPPVALATMRERIDHLARLRTANIEISGGEPLLHPELDELIRHIRGTGALAGLITNGYLLNETRIERFNNAGLDHLQISIDNVTPDDVSKKSLKVLDAKLQMLAKHAAFSVNINSVLGGDLGNPEDALTIARRAIELGLTTTVGLILNGAGRLIPLTAEQLRVYNEITALAAPFYTVQNQNDFQRNLAFGRPNDWQCRGRPLSLHLRGRPRALVLAAARASRYPAGSVHHRGCAAREHEREKLCSALHGVLRAPRGAARPHSQAANRDARRNDAGRRRRSPERARAPLDVRDRPASRPPARRRRASARLALVARRMGFITLQSDLPTTPWRLSRPPCRSLR